MIKIIELVLTIGATIMDLIIRRSRKKDEDKQKMFEHSKIHDIDAIRDANQTKEYKKMKEELQKPQKEGDAGIQR